MTNCMTLKGNLLLFAHHFVSGYLYLGPLLFNPLYHLIISIFVLLQWIIYGCCIITEYTNKYCGLNKKEKFKDIIQIIGLHKINKKIHYYLIALAILIDLYLVYNKYLA